MLRDLVASYNLKLHEGVPIEELNVEIAETLELMKGIQRWNTLDLPDGSIAFELHIHGQTDKEIADKLGQRVEKILQRLDMAAVEYYGIEFPDEVRLAKEKWQGRESIDEIVREFEGSSYIRLDYYTRGLSCEDLGINDPNLEMLMVQALQKWPQKSVGREAIRRFRDHFERLAELRGAEGPAPARGRTTRASTGAELTRPRAVADVDRAVAEDRASA